MEDNEKSKKKQKKREILKTIGNVLFWVIIVCLFVCNMDNRFCKNSKRGKTSFLCKKDRTQIR